MVSPIVPEKEFETEDYIIEYRHKEYDLFDDSFNVLIQDTLTGDTEVIFEDSEEEAIAVFNKLKSIL